MTANLCFAHRENAFTLLRYVFALSLMAWHYCVLTGMHYPLPLTAERCVQGFFILSGFLTMVSFERPFTPAVYIQRRFYRTVLPYWIPVIVCFVAGTLLTTLSVKEYLLHTDTWRYLFANLSFLNFLQPELPGVFAHNPLTAVNGALWSMKVELLFYVSVPLLHFLFKRFRALPILFLFFMLSVAYNEVCLHLYAHTKDVLYLFLKRQLPGQYIYFCGGMLAYHIYPYVCRHRFTATFISVLFVLLSTVIAPLNYFNILIYSLLLAFLAYLIPNYQSGIGRLPNLTYGLYLYHFPVIQIFIASGFLSSHLLIGTTGAFVVSVMLAMAAWRWIEQPLHRKSSKNKAITCNTK
ncbi:MAG: acyltransferase [Clostridium sp.]|nr:acyltransferase [Clostridium sp.]